MQFDPKKTVFLIDGSSMLYRGYYAMKPLHTSKGMPVQAVYNFCRMIKRLIDIFSPELMALVWDSKGKTVRHERYPDYKSTRQAPPSDLFTQKEYILSFADLIGIAQVAREGVEADDLLFSLAQDFVSQGYHVVIVSSDKDMGQMISDHVWVYDAFKENTYDVSTFTELMGFAPSKLCFYSALVGDAVDNIPGVKGIGKKTALSIVQEYESLDDVYAHIDDIKPTRARTALEAHKHDAYLSYDLFLLHYYAMNRKVSDLSFSMDNWHKARSLFKELEFTSLLKELGETKEERDLGEQEIIATLKKHDFQLVTTQEQLVNLCAELKKFGAFAFDTETTGLRTLEVALVGVSFCAQEGRAFYVPCGHVTNEQQVTIVQFIEIMGPLFIDESVKKYAHHAKYDRLVLENHGIAVRGYLFDTHIAASLVTKSWQSSMLKKLSLYYFDEPMLTFEQVVTDKGYKDFSYVPLETALYYSASDAHQTMKLVPLLSAELEAQEMTQLFETIEMPLVDVLCAMEKEGMILDVQELDQVNRIITKGLVVLEKEIFTLSGAEINLNSPRQVGELLFDTLNLPHPEKSGKSSKTGSYSTGQDVLVQLAKEHPVPGLLLKYRELAKLKSTYLDALPAYINKKTGRIHTSFSQVRVATGRLASSDPNMQNIPTTAYGIAIRGAFKPPRGHVFISADYSQIELRVLAHLSQDANLINAFLNGHDIHAETAARLFDVSLSEVTHDQRQLGKRINFSILYGLTPFGLSKDLDIHYADAKKYIEKYFAQYPGVSAWMEEVISFVKKHGYVVTHWGRRRDVPGIYEKNKHLYDEARRIAINTVAQGTSAEIMKMGMNGLQKAFRERGIDAKILLQIHDELLISVSEHQSGEAESLMIQVLDSVVDWSIPFVVTTRVGTDWKQVSK